MKRRIRRVPHKDPETHEEQLSLIKRVMTQKLHTQHERFGQLLLHSSKKRVTPRKKEEQVGTALWHTCSYDSEICQWE